jgi:hypothetical protein
MPQKLGPHFPAGTPVLRTAAYPINKGNRMIEKKGVWFFLNRRGGWIISLAAEEAEAA